MNEPLLKVIAGSHLHGFAGPYSDLDYITVVPEKRTAKTWHSRQTIVDGVDSVEFGLSTWMHYCSIGTPQALDAMFAPSDFVLVDNLGYLRQSYRVFPNDSRSHISGFINQIVKDRWHESKQRRHAFRLALNWMQLERQGRYNPCLGLEDREIVLNLARAGDIKVLRDMTGFSLSSPLGR